MIYIFKTSVTTKKLVKQLKPQLDNICIDGSWNFDLEDFDKILRLNVSKKVKEETISFLKSQNILCNELH
ncbi:hypothetical protein [Zunongwangia sp.]|uniref:hypothetical protein n=1 Tax=Zunongwangia sp. TaxID=1965325 RepID=UPI003AA98095